MACVHPCIERKLENIKINSISTDPKTAKINEAVIISVEVVDISWIIGQSAVIDIINISTGDCLYTESFWIDKGAAKSFNTTILMPDKDLKIRASVTTLGFLGAVCEDYKEVSVLLSKPGITRHTCLAGTCTPSATGEFDNLLACTSSGCKAPAGGGECGTGKMSLFGKCYKTSDLAIATGAVVLFMMMSRS